MEHRIMPDATAASCLVCFSDTAFFKSFNDRSRSLSSAIWANVFFALTCTLTSDR